MDDATFILYVLGYIKKVKTLMNQDDGEKFAVEFYKQVMTNHSLQNF